MKNNLKKLLSVILCAVLLFTTASTAFAAEETRTVVDSGFCGAQGENLTWTLYEDGELVISGEGEMAFYYYSETAYNADSPFIPPWYDMLSNIKIITINEGVTGISDDAFSSKVSGYYRVNLPKSLKYYFLGSFSNPSSQESLGKVLACCYPGSSSDWDKVIMRVSRTIHLGNNFTEIVKYEYENKSWGSGINGNNGEIMYYDGKEPEIFCKIYFDYDTQYKAKIENHGTASIYVKYYSDDYTDAKLVWRTEGDACKIEYVEQTTSGMPISADIISVTHGDYSVIVELVGSDGTVIESRRVDFFSYVPEDMTSAEKFDEFTEEIKEWLSLQFAGVTLLGGFTFVYGILAPIISVVFSPYYLFLTIRELVRNAKK